MIKYFFSPFTLYPLKQMILFLKVNKYKEDIHVWYTNRKVLISILHKSHQKVVMIFQN